MCYNTVLCNELMERGESSKDIKGENNYLITQGITITS